VLSIARHRQHQILLSTQDERHLVDNLDAIHELIIGLNTGHFLEDTFGQQPLPYVARLHGMAVQRYQTYAQRILDVQADTKALIERCTGRPLQEDLPIRSVARKQLTLISADMKVAGMVVTWRSGEAYYTVSLFRYDTRLSI